MANIVNLTKVGSNTPIARLVQGDKNSEKITFVLPEIDASIDDLDWRVIINGAEGLKDTAPLEIIRTEKEVQLPWTCSWSAAAEVGMTTLQIEGYDPEGNCQWRSGEYCIDVGPAKDDGEASEPEGITQMQQLIQAAINDTANAADEARAAGLEAERIATKGIDIVNGIENIFFQPGFFPITNIGTTIDITQRSPSTTGMYSGVSECNPGDIISVNIQGAGSSSGGARAYAFLDENCVVLDRSGTNIVCANTELIAPENTKYIVINTKTTDENYYAFVGELAKKVFERQAKLIEEIDYHRDLFSSRIDINPEYDYPAYLNPNTGSNGGIASGDNVNKYCSTGYVRYSETIRVVCNSDMYMVLAWVYKEMGYQSAVYSPTNNVYTTNGEFVIKKRTDCNYFKLGFCRVDGAELNMDESDENSDINKFKAAITFYVRRDTNLVDPDDYEGTDNEKLKKAMDAIGDDGTGVILIKRMYSLTSPLRISHNGKNNSKLTFFGIGKECGFIMSGSRIVSADGTTSYGQCHFANLLFQCVDKTAQVFLADYLIRMSFENCVFENGYCVVRGERFVQSWYFHNCIIRNFSSWVLYLDYEEINMLVDVQFNQCMIEYCKGVLRAYAAHGVTFNQCCIEGLYGLGFKIVGDMRSFNVTNCYFEGNNNGVYVGEDEIIGNGETFDLTEYRGTTQEFTFVGNRVSLKATDNVILLPPKAFLNSYYIIENNHCSNQNGTLIKVHDAATEIYKSVKIRNNSWGKYSNMDLLTDETKCSVGVVQEIETGVDLSTVNHPGYYHASDGHGITDAPTEGEFFMMVMRTNGSTVQVYYHESGTDVRLVKATQAAI